MRLHRSFFSRLSSADVGFSPLPQFASREKTVAPCKILAPRVQRFSPGGSNTFSGFFLVLEYPSSASSSYEELESNKNRRMVR